MLQERLSAYMNYMVLNKDLHRRGKRKKQRYCSQKLYVLPMIGNIHLRGLGLSIMRYVLKCNISNILCLLIKTYDLGVFCLHRQWKLFYNLLKQKFFYRCKCALCMRYLKKDWNPQQYKPQNGVSDQTC